MTRRIDAVSRDRIKRWEALRLDAYLDRPGGKWTIGWGHTRSAREGLRITEPEAEALLSRDLAPCEQAVDSLVKVPLTDNQFGALVSFVFNVGVAAFENSTLLEKLNAGDYAAVPAQLLRWVKDGGEVVTGLVNRRNAEIGLWSKGSFVESADASSGPIEPTKPPIITKRTAGGAAVGGTAVAVATEILSHVGEAAGPISAIRLALSGVTGSEALMLAGLLAVVAIGAVLWMRSRKEAVA